jgi:predicted enzyme related to lactoylglutathione lyase
VAFVSRPLISPLPFPLTYKQTITWTEIPCTDLERVQTFYSTVFGWDINSSPNSEVSFFTKGTTNGSFVKLEPKNLLSPAIHPDNPDKGLVALRVTINVESVDESLKQVEKAGGSLYM